MQQYKAELAFKTESTLGESPMWHPQQQKLYWVDIEKMELHNFDPSTTLHKIFKTEKRIGSVVPAKNGHLILALQGEIAELDPSTNTIKKLIDLEPHLPMNRCNDGKCDNQGNLWIGTMHINCKAGEGSLYCIDSKLNVVPVMQNLSISNGMCWSLAGDKMYFIDSSDRCVKCFDFNITKHELSNEKVVVKSRTDTELPDGMCLDSEGMLWVAFWGGQRVGRYNPKTGEPLAHIEVPALNVTSCCFGGADLKTLYITTAQEGLSQHQLLEYPLSGSLFSCSLQTSEFCGLAVDFFDR
jgi:sugar lactone lactonase YvrE